MNTIWIQVSRSLWPVSVLASGYLWKGPDSQDERCIRNTTGHLDLLLLYKTVRIKPSLTTLKPLERRSMSVPDTDAKGTLGCPLEICVCARTRVVWGLELCQCDNLVFFILCSWKCYPLSAGTNVIDKGIACQRYACIHLLSFASFQTSYEDKGMERFEIVLPFQLWVCLKGLARPL